MPEIGDTRPAPPPVAQQPVLPQFVVVDGSNIATEGRSTPSLVQLDEAVRTYVAETPDVNVIVVVDATFAHRIDAAERAELEQAELHGEVVAPPAGTVGRGDAFVLRIAERAGATVLSNDSFQEFHGEHPWLFEPNRLIGGKPVPGVGWIFAPRTPVRGAKSRAAVQSSRRPRRGEATRSRPQPGDALRSVAAEVEKEIEATPASGTDGAASDGANENGAVGKATATMAVTKKAATKAGATKKAAAKKAATKAVATKKAGATKKEPPEKGEPTETVATKATTEKAPTKRATAKKAVTRVAATEKAVTKRATAKKATAKAPAKKAAATKAPAKKAAGANAPARRAPEPEPAGPPVPGAGPRNDPLQFIAFAAEHPIGTLVPGTVTGFASHGALVDVELDDHGVLHCYVPLSGLGDPPPRRAREVVERGQARTFLVRVLDTLRRTADLELASGEER